MTALPGSDAPRHRAPRTWRRTGVWSAVCLVIVLGLAAGIYGWQVASAYNQAKQVPGTEVFPPPSTRPDSVPRPANASNDPVNMLLLGSDSSTGGAGDPADVLGRRSDTMILVNIPANRESVNLMSIMRDNWVEIPGYGTTKINAAMSHGGTPLAVQAVEGLLNIRIDHVAVIDFDGLAGLTDSMGGVPIDNLTPFSCGGDVIAAGEVTLNGEQALCFVRNRDFVDGDYTRVANQQHFLLSLADQMLSPDTLVNPLTVRDSIDAISPYITMDEGLTMSTVVSLRLSLRDLGAIHTFTSPTLGMGTEGDQSVVYPDREELQVVSRHLREDTFTSYILGDAPDVVVEPVGAIP